MFVANENRASSTSLCLQVQFRNDDRNFRRDGKTEETMVTAYAAILSVLSHDHLATRSNCGKQLFSLIVPAEITENMSEELD